MFCIKFRGVVVTFFLFLSSALYLPLLLLIGCSSNEQYYSKQSTNRYALSEEHRADNLSPGFDTFFDSYKTVIKDSMAAHDIPGLAIAVVNRDELLWEAGFGVRNRESGKPVNRETVFSLQSITKLFTATAIMKEVQKGTIDLDAPITKYLPDFSVNSRFSEHPEEKITVRHLLHHASGLTHEAAVGNNYDAYSPSFDAHVATISDTWLKYPVGQQRSYSNLGYDLAGYILQKQSGIPYETYMEDSLLTPLGMNRSFVDRPEQELCSNCAAGHDNDFEKLPEYVPMTAAGGVRVDAGDGARFIQFHLNRGKTSDGQNLLASRFFEEIYSQPIIRDSNWSKNVWVGMAVVVAKDDNADTYMMRMSGGGFGYLVGMAWYPEYGLGAVVLTNSVDHPGVDNDIVRNVIRQIVSKDLVDKIDDPSIPSVDEFYERELAKSPAVESEREKGKITPYRPEWEKYIGKYRLPRGGGYKPSLPADSTRGCIRVFKKKEALYISGCGPSADGDPLVEYKPGLFFHRSAGEALDFRGDPPTWASIALSKVGD